MVENKITDKKKFPGLLLGAVAFALAYYGVQQIFFTPSFDKAMMQAASEINKTCPVVVDKETRLDNAVALPGNVFEYNYTAVNLERSKIDTNLLKRVLNLI